MSFKKDKIGVKQNSRHNTFLKQVTERFCMCSLYFYSCLNISSVSDN